jgi:primase-polymerase (primpol)-like protein
MALQVCEMCGADLPLLVRSHARTCSTRCRKALSRRQVPAELRDAPRWVSHTATKRPIRIDGAPASSTDPATWASYSAVRDLPRKGFVLNGDGLVCIDVDHCAEGGVLDPAAKAWLAELPATYVEWSPSGTGIHIWGHGYVPTGRKLTFRGLRVEVYGSGRYITVTNKPLRGSPVQLADLTGHLPL